MLQAHVDHCV